MTIGLIAKLTIAEGKNAEFEQTMSELVAQVNAKEPGAEFYQVFKSRTDAQEYVVLEKYVDQAALDAHGKTDHFRALGKKMGACMAGAPTLELLDGI